MNTKFTLLLFTTLTIAVASNAQISKGSSALGGNLSFSTATNNYASGKQKQSNIFIAPSLMMINKDNHAIGFNIYYSHLNADISGKSNVYGAGVFLRQYKPLGKGFYIFAQEALSYNYGKGSVDSSMYYSFVDNISNEINVTVNPGIAYDLSKRFQLELLFFNNLLSASYERSKLISHYNGTDLVQKFNSFSAGANLAGSQLTSLNIGAKIFFGR
jgi:hypothetical protein